jgi:hypothetical protein
VPIFQLNNLPSIALSKNKFNTIDSDRKIVKTESRNKKTLFRSQSANPKLE